MKFKFLGTAAYEGIPSLFCECEKCRRSRETGGRAIRTRSQAIIDGELLIDFPADTYAHIVYNGIDTSKIHYCLITHSHSDHLYERDLPIMQHGFGAVSDDYKITFYATQKAGEPIDGKLKEKLYEQGTAALVTVSPFESLKVGDYNVTVLPAIHDPDSGPVFYQIEKDGKTVLYAHDTNYFSDEVWEYFEKAKPHFDMVSLDCTNACLPLNYVGHMGLAENVRVKNRMLDMGIADEKTVFICNHFSHNGTDVVYDDFVPIAAKEGFKVSFDGMEIDI